MLHIKNVENKVYTLNLSSFNLAISSQSVLNFLSTETTSNTRKEKKVGGGGKGHIIQGSTAKAVH